MTRFSNNSIVWLYEDKLKFEIWPITDSVMPDENSFAFDTKWLSTESSFYTAKSKIYKSNLFSGSISKDGSECGSIEGVVFYSEGRVALVGRWHENADIMDFIAQFTPRK